MNPDLGRPEMYLWQNIAVPPVCIRPSVQQDDTSNEDDITVKLTEVIFTNAHMQAGLNQGIAIHNLMVGVDSFFSSFPRFAEQHDPKASTDTYC